MKKKNSTAQRKKVKFDNKHLNDPKIKKVYLTFKKQLYSQIKNEKFCIGVSGGPDSLALAFLAKVFSIEFNSKFIALIVNHNLRKQSGFEAQKVKKILHKNARARLSGPPDTPMQNFSFLIWEYNCFLKVKYTFSIFGSLRCLLSNLTFFCWAVEFFFFIFCFLKNRLTRFWILLAYSGNH